MCDCRSRRSKREQPVRAMQEVEERTVKRWIEGGVRRAMRRAGTPVLVGALLAIAGCTTAPPLVERVDARPVQPAPIIIVQPVPPEPPAPMVPLPVPEPQ
jgi:hypothetical protein